MGKYKMPKVEQFLKKKRIYDGKKDPVWAYLEKEMLQNVDKKPYNEKVGQWLRFLKDLRYYFHCEAKRKEKRLVREIGPAWYVELSSSQREVLEKLKENIHQDLLEDLPRRVRKSLSDLGITLKIPRKVLMKSMTDSYEDPGVFIWSLYKAIYKMSPSVIRKKYDMNAMILMSCLVFIDLEECTEKLEKLTHSEKPPPEAPKKKKNKNSQPNVKYGEYLQKNYVPYYTSRQVVKKKRKALPLGYKFRLRSDESYEKLITNNNFLEKRKERNKKEKQIERACKYKFWEPPSTLRNTDPKMVAYVNKLHMLKERVRVRFHAPYKNVQFLIGGVSFTGGRPNYMLANVSLLPTGYISINGGVVMSKGGYVTCIHGFWKFPREEKEKCDNTCECLNKWETTAMDFLKKSKCKCGHLYDYYNEGPKVKEKYFHPSTKHAPFWFDRAKIYQQDAMEDFIIDTFRDAMKSNEATPEPSTPTICASGLKESELLGAFLADLSDSALLIPHLPQANLLNNLQEWTRERVKAKIKPTNHKKMILQSQRRWLDLKHMDFRARAFRIPFTLKQLENIKWSHRKLVQKLFNILLEDFVTRNRLKQVEQTRLWWSTMKYDAYPSKAFLDIFFTYMPGRMKDTYLINPYSSDLTPKSGAKTCPLD